MNIIFKVLTYNTVQLKGTNMQAVSAVSRPKEYIRHLWSPENQLDIRQNRIIVNDYAPLLKEGHLTDKSDDGVRHLKTILAQGEGILNLQKFKC